MSFLPSSLRAKNILHKCYIHIKLYIQTYTYVYTDNKNIFENIYALFVLRNSKVATVVGDDCELS